MNITQMVQDVKTGATVGIGTAATGVSTWFEWIPSDIGKLAALVGLVLSCVLIYIHWKKGRLERALLHEQLKEARAKRNRKPKQPYGSGQE